MFSFFRAGCEELLRIPPEPEPPPGDEKNARVFRAAPAFFHYQVVWWTLRTLFGLLIPSLIFLGIYTEVAAEAGKRLMNPAAPTVVLAIAVGSLGIVLIACAFSLAIARLNYEKRWYVVTDRSLRIREGVLQVREMTVSFANIQNLTVVQGPIEQLLGIANLQVETAGGGGSSVKAAKRRSRPGPDLHTARFRGIDNADEVRDLIQRRLRALKDSGLGDQHEATAESAAAGNRPLIEALRMVHLEAVALREASMTRAV